MKKSVRYFQDKAPHRPPPLWLTSLEPGRFAAEYIALKASRRYLLRSAAGDGHSVIVLPGLFASDSTTKALRTIVGEAGYSCVGWGQGTNLGPQGNDDLENQLGELIEQRYKIAGNRPVTLIGWSLGGVYARLAAHLSPDKVRQVITLGSPINGSPKLTNAWRLFELLSDVPVDASQNQEKLSRAMQALPVPGTSIYSKSDSIVAWQISRAAEGHMQQSIQVPASHLGMAFNPLVVKLVLDLLTQDAAQWTPYEPNAPESWLYHAA